MINRLVLLVSTLHDEAIATRIHGDFGAGADKRQDSIICRIVQIYADYEDGASDETLCTLIVDARESAYSYDIDLPESLLTQHSDYFKNGDLFISIEGATLTNSTVQLSETSTVSVLQDYFSHQVGIRASTDYTNAQRNRTLAVIAISLSDSPLMFSKENISFTLWQQPIRVQTQFAACSLGQLNWRPAGVYEVVLDKSIADIDSVATAKNHAVEKLIRQGHISASGSAQDLADNVMFFIPPLAPTLGFIANAGSPSWQSTYSNKWSLDLNTVLHELVRENFVFL
jgi:hypothetical protein